MIALKVAELPIGNPGPKHSQQSIRFLVANVWNRLPNSLLLEAMKIFQIEKFLRDFSINSIRCLNVPSFCMYSGL